MKKGLRYGLLGLLLLLIAGVAAPFIRVDQYREQIRAGLERELHRKVEIYGDAHLNLFRGPGFSVEKVVIYDDPNVGLEPLANVAELQTTLSFSSLFTGRIDFSTVRLVEPSLNLVKPDNGSWNVLMVLAGANTSSSSASNNRRLPEIQVSSGRINFKFGQTKSAFYLTDTDLTVSPARDGIEIRFSGAPSRTDRLQQPHGLFSGRGRIQNGNIDLDAQLEKSPVEDLVTLVRGQSLGVHGTIASRAHISGPLTNPRITGHLDVEDIHRWDLNPGRSGTLSADYKGSFDLKTQVLDISAEKPFHIRLLMDRVLTHPAWQFEAAFSELPASGLVDLARHMGAPLPLSMTTDGVVAGTVRYGSRDGVTGQLSVENAVFHLDGAPEIRLDLASLSLDGDQVRLLPAQTDNGQIEAVYAPFRQHLEATLTSKGMEIEPVVYGVSVPILSRFQGGTWGGMLHYLADETTPPGGTWAANIALQNTQTTVPGVASPIQITAADVRAEGPRLEVHRLRAVAGPVEFYGEYRYVATDTRPHQFAISIPSADLAELEQLLLPSLQHGGSSFLARTLRWRASAPEWLRERRATGEVRVGSLTVGDTTFRALRTRVLWNGVTVQLPALEARVEDGNLTGRLTADLSRAVPHYTMTGTVRNLAWKDGHVDLDGELTSSGVGVDAIANLIADGKFQARAVSITPETFRTASGLFDLSVNRLGPQIRLSDVQAALGSEKFNGAGSTQPDGQLQVEMSSTTRAMRLSGTVAALKLALSDLPQNR